MLSSAIGLLLYSRTVNQNCLSNEIKLNKFIWANVILFRFRNDMICWNALWLHTCVIIPVTYYHIHIVVIVLHASTSSAEKPSLEVARTTLRLELLSLSN